MDLNGITQRVKTATRWLSSTLAISVFRLPDWVTFYELLLFLDRVRPRPKKKRLAGQPENSIGKRVQLLILGLCAVWADGLRPVICRLAARNFQSICLCFLS